MCIFPIWLQQSGYVKLGSSFWLLLHFRSRNNDWKKYWCFYFILYFCSVAKGWMETYSVYFRFIRTRIDSTVNAVHFVCLFFCVSSVVYIMKTGFYCSRHLRRCYLVFFLVYKFVAVRIWFKTQTIFHLYSSIYWINQYSKIFLSRR